MEMTMTTIPAIVAVVAEAVQGVGKTALVLNDDSAVAEETLDFILPPAAATAKAHVLVWHDAQEKKAPNGDVPRRIDFPQQTNVDGMQQVQGQARIAMEEAIKQQFLAQKRRESY